MPLNFLQRRPSNEHLGDKVEAIRVNALLGVSAILFLIIPELLLWTHDRLSNLELMVAIFVVNPVVVVVVGRLLTGSLNRIAAGSIGTLLATRGGKRKNEFSLVESMIVRGRFNDAANELRSHLVAYPEDVGAKVKLAELTAEHLGDREAAVRLFLEARSMQPDRHEQGRIHNWLIDLYRAMGKPEELNRELARFESGRVK